MKPRWVEKASRNTKIKEKRLDGIRNFIIRARWEKSIVYAWKLSVKWILVFVWKFFFLDTLKWKKYAARGTKNGNHEWMFTYVAEEFLMTCRGRGERGGISKDEIPSHGQ